MTISFHPDQRRCYPGDPDLQDLMQYWAMCERFKHLWMHLNKVFDFKVVISSTWRNHLKTPENVIDVFETNGLPINLHTDWRTSNDDIDYNEWEKISDGVGYPCSRLFQVEQWLEQHPEVKNWIAFDDEGSGYSMYRALKVLPDKYKNNLILVDMDRGFGRFDMLKTIEIMKGWK